MPETNSFCNTGFHFNILLPLLTVRIEEFSREADCEQFRAFYVPLGLEMQGESLLPHLLSGGIKAAEDRAGSVGQNAQAITISWKGCS